MKETKERILDTAERLFAERGYGETSLRSITAKAGVNLASVHYHFHSKEALLDAVILRRAEPVNLERLALLDEYQRAAGDGPLPVEKVLEALLVPAIRLARDAARNGPTFVKLMGRVLGEESILPSLIRKHFSVVFERFVEALRRALPELEMEELLWRVHFTIGVMAHTLCGGEKVNLGNELALERMVAFISAGFRAPVKAAAGSHA